MPTIPKAKRRRSVAAPSEANRKPRSHDEHSPPCLGCQRPTGGYRQWCDDCRRQRLVVSQRGRAADLVQLPWVKDRIKQYELAATFGAPLFTGRYR